MKKVLLCVATVLFLCISVNAQAQLLGAWLVHAAARSDVLVNGEKVTVMTSVYCTTSEEGVLLVSEIMNRVEVVPSEYVPEAFVLYAQTQSSRCHGIPLVVHQILAEEHDTMFEK